MRIKQSFFLNGPQISDVLEGALSGLDLSGTGIDGGSPGDVVYFNLFLSIEATETEQQLYDYISNLKLYVEQNSSYFGDSSAGEDLTDILELGDLGYGLAIKNPANGLYDLRINNSNYKSEATALLIKKEMMRNYDLSDTSNPTVISNEGFLTATASSSSSGYSLVSTSAVFNSKMVGARVFNLTDNTSAVIDSYVSSTNVILKTAINDTWDGDSIRIKTLIEPLDGVIAINSGFAEVVGNYAHLEFEFSLPASYKRNGIKQVSLKIISGNE